MALTVELEEPLIEVFLLGQFLPVVEFVEALPGQLKALPGQLKALQVVSLHFFTPEFILAAFLFLIDIILE